MRDAQDVRCPLSAAQHGIWLGQQLDLQSPVYNAAECIEFHGAVVPELFEAALRQTIAEAEALHARFVADGDAPVQLLGTQPDWMLHTADLSDATDPWEVAQAWMQDDLTRTVDLSRGPLFAQAFFKAAPDRFFWYQRVHHIAMDGFGFSLLARRVAELYTSKVTGRPATGGFGSLKAVLDEDVAYRAGDQFRRDREFWTERLADRPVPVGLATPAPMSSRFVRQTRFLSPGDLGRLEATSRQAGLSWPDLVFAATAAYLHQRTGATEAVIGMPVMSRLGSAALRVPCMAMNIVPLRVQVPAGGEFLEVARQVALELRAARPHLRYRYEQLRRDLQLVGGSRRLFGPVVNVMPFDYGLSFAGVPATAHNLSAGPVEDLSIGLYARSGGNGLRVDFDANPACYSAEELDAHQRDFLQLLDAVVREPRSALRHEQGTAKSPAQHPAVIIDGGPLPAPSRPVLELIAERVQEHPNAIAVEHGTHRLSYRELLQAARAVADQLAAAGVQPDSPVAVMVPRSIDAIVASLGVLISGAGYLPLDPQGPSTRTDAILEDARPELIITTEAASTSPSAPGKLTVRRNPRLATAESPSRPVPHASRATDEHLAYVIYTSGSTGQPNGVQIHHGALAHFVAGATWRYNMSCGDRVLQFAPLHFDASVEEIFLTLCIGGTLVLRTEEMLQSVPRLLSACAEHGITVLDLPTAFWHELAYSISTDAARLPPSIRLVIIGGEAALPERVARWRATVAPEVLLLNTYGPTEATVVATAATLNGSAHPRASEEVPIGRPLPGVSAAIMDSQGQPATPGAEGELYLMGGGLARGYWRRPEVDAARFVAVDSLPGRPRAYRTGDKVKLREDGELVFVGRVDDEFKISGHRIDPAEVESVLLSLPGVREAVVIGQVLPGGVRRLCAHLVAESPPPAAAELRRALLAKLPAPMVPGIFVFSEQLPRTPTGKLDRNALRRALPTDESSAIAAATELERVVLQVWEQVLGVSATSAQDDFFELGGQSLQTIQVANRLSVALGREVPVATVFRYPTAAALAQALEQGGAKSHAVNGGLTPAMLADAELPADIVPAPAGGQTSLRQVLLTGATGFVGAHLLDQLLRQTDARIVCLVRAQDEAQALNRIRESLVAQHLPTSGLDRVLALPADLAQQWLGLGSARFHALAAECDAIYHNAAVVSLVREYGSLQAVNVRSTRELLRMAAAVRSKPLHYVSTLAVAPPLNLSPEVPEAFVPPHPGLADGYQQSKWVAERLVQQAAERGLPAAVYRLGRVVSVPGRGSINTQDLVWRIVLAGVPAGALPQLAVGEAWTPVDFVARALVRLSLEPRPGAVFNLAPTPEVQLSDVFGWVRDYGYPVDLCPVPEWRARVEARAGGADSTATLAFFDLRAGASEPPLGLGSIRCERVLQGLEGSGISCPRTDRSLMYRYLDSCVEQGLLPPSPRARKDARDDSSLSP
ncbi:myxochelin non-ribosomal peptide synthetase MxcG [Hyalangium versicolor]|uniref:myxochelin non-ribosomal peptide synthetase MxcG n=1 Tax=Hyalangium versicolor TaxID=2861190 RepID=UPI001CC8FD0D|nr:myxochelin non-ribosomal peptide synthetase MxcG [Hyalangium versicolor]